jgi:hypothetical protein
MESGGAMKKIAFLTVCLIFAVTFVVNAQGSDFPKLSGSYLGQKPPGMTPEVFAPGFVSTKFGELNSIFSPDGKEFYFSRRGIPGKPSVLMVTKMESDGWTEPRPLPFSGTYDDIDLFLCADNQRLVFCSSRSRIKPASGPRIPAFSV